MAALPVLVGPVVLLKVTSFVLNQGYKIAQVGGGSSYTQMIAPTEKKIVIEAFLVDKERIWRPILESLALVNRLLAAAVSPATSLAGIPVVARLGVHLDMQITSLVFTQDNSLRDTLKVQITLQHVPRSSIAEGIGAGLDLAMGVAGGLIP